MIRSNRLLLALTVGLVAAAPATAQAPAKLAPKREAALSETIDKRQKLDQLKDGKNDIARLRRQCDRLPAADPVLKAYAEICRADAEITAGYRLYFRCQTNPGCRTAIRKIRGGIGDFRAAAEPLNAALRAQIADADCVEALDVGRSERAGYRALGDAWRLMGAAFKNGSERQFDRAQARLRRVRGIPSNTQNRDRFRRNCTDAENV